MTEDIKLKHGIFPLLYKPIWTLRILLVMLGPTIHHYELHLPGLHNKKPPLHLDTTASLGLFQLVDSLLKLHLFALFLILMYFSLVIKAWCSIFVILIVFLNYYLLYVFLPMSVDLERL